MLWFNSRPVVWAVEKTFGLLSMSERFDDDVYAVYRWARLKRWKRSEHAKQVRAELAERKRLKSLAMEAFKAAKARERAEKRRAEELIREDHVRRCEERRAAERARKQRWESFEQKAGYLQHVFELEEDKRARRGRGLQNARVIEQRPYEHANAMRTGEELHAAWLKGHTHISLARNSRERPTNKPPLQLPAAIAPPCDDDH